MLFPRTKIVATLGPASHDAKTISRMITEGLCVARLNFSHGTHADHAKLIRLVRAAERKAGRPMAILQDLQGPKIRLGVLPEQGIEAKEGARLVLPLTQPSVLRDLKRGHRVLVEDGRYELRFLVARGKRMEVEVVRGGVFKSHKGLNFPDSTLQVEAFSKKDREDARFGVMHGVDWVALSFVRGAEDIRALRTFLAKTKRTELPRILAKIETRDAVANFQKILDAADGVLIARGDLGIECDPQDVPVLQKRFVEACRAAGKPVIVATHMLDSMTREPRPTRAEVSDVANAVVDHTDAVMLSAESATGKYPVETISMMRDILLETESSPYDNVSASASSPSNRLGQIGLTMAGLAAVGVIRGIAVSGYAVEDPWALVSHRPEAPVYFVGPQVDARRAALVSGFVPIVVSSRQQPRTGQAWRVLLRKHLGSKHPHAIALIDLSLHAGFIIFKI